MLKGFTSQQIIFLVILGLSFGVLLTERLRNDVVAVLIILALASGKVLTPDEALSGFGSEPAIVLAAIFVLSAALYHTGISETIGSWIGRLAGTSYSRALAVIMPSVALLSAFTHHVTTTAVMLPVTLDLARERNIPASKLLMPLSFAASLGTTITIIGAPAFLVASSVLRQNGRPGLGIFSIAPIGLALSAVGTIFTILVGRFLLPSRTGTQDQLSRFRLDEYFTELTVLPDSPFLDKTLEEAETASSYNLKIVGWVRDGRHLQKRARESRLMAGDVLLVRTTPEDILAIRKEPGVELHPVARYGSDVAAHGRDVEDIADLLVQAVVAPRSDLVGRTIGEIDFAGRFGALVVGIWRRAGWINEQLANIRLRAGDVLVLQGDESSIGRVSKDPAFLMLVPFHAEAQLRRKAPLAGAIMLLAILAAAMNLLPLEMAMLAGALAVVLTGCITARQAYRAIDARIYVFIAGAIPLGAAMQKTGTSTLLAGWLQSAVGDWSQTAILLALFAIVAVLTQFMSDAATTAIFAPVAVALAQALGKPPEPYAVTVAMAAVAAFLTPIGHHGNLLVYGPGGYQFRDFVRAGTPLTILSALVVVFVAQMIWPA